MIMGSSAFHAELPVCSFSAFILSFIYKLQGFHSEDQGSMMPSYLAGRRQCLQQQLDLGTFCVHVVLPSR